MDESPITSVENIQVIEDPESGVQFGIGMLVNRSERPSRRQFIFGRDLRRYAPMTCEKKVRGVNTFVKTFEP
jgi:hypothetical protein